MYYFCLQQINNGSIELSISRRLKRSFLGFREGSAVNERRRFYNVITCNSMSINVIMNLYLKMPKERYICFSCCILTKKTKGKSRFRTTGILFTIQGFNNSVSSRRNTSLNMNFSFLNNEYKIIQCIQQ